MNPTSKLLDELFKEYHKRKFKMEERQQQIAQMKIWQAETAERIVQLLPFDTSNLT